MFVAAVVYAFWPSKKDEFDRAARSVLDDEDGPMSVEERDPLTGHQTTGHEWNGITELNTRVPRAVWWAIGITHVWALVMWILLPTWPLVTTYTKGLLGIDQRELVAGRARGGRALPRAMGGALRRRRPRRHPPGRGPDADRVRRGAGALGRQLRGVPRPRGRRRPRLPEPRRRRLALGRRRRRRCSRPCASASTPPIPRRASPRCWPSARPAS